MQRESSQLENGIKRDLASSMPSTFDKYIAIFIDLLGQSDQLDIAQDLFTPDCLHDSATHNAFEKTVKKVLFVADGFKKSFEFHNEKIPGYPKIVDQYFSDSMIFYAPLVNPDGLLNQSRIWAIFVAAALCQISALGSEIPIRGGIDIGLAAVQSPIGIYGPLVKKVHYLESRVAAFPRIVIGENCMKFLHKCADTWPDSFASLILGTLVTTWDDDCPMIDFMGSDVKRTTDKSEKLLSPENRVSTYVSHIYHFTRKMKEHFKILYNSEKGKSKEKAELLFNRYSILFEYVKDRKNVFWKSST